MLPELLTVTPKLLLVVIALDTGAS